MKIGAFDLEHKSGSFRPWNEGFYVSCIGMIDSEGTKKVLWLDHSQNDSQRTQKEVLDEFQEWLDSLDLVVAHNMKHDMHIMRYFGIDFDNVNIWCTQVAE